MPKPSQRDQLLKSAGPGSKSRGRLAGDHRRLPVYLSRSILVLACFVLFLPLIVSREFYYPFVFLKSILFRAAVEAMVLLYVTLWAADPAYRPRPDRITFALLPFFGAMLVCSLPGISLDAWNSWWGSFARMGGMITQLHLLAYFLILAHALRRDRDWPILFAASLFSGVLMGFSGLVQSVGLDYFYPLAPGGRIQGATGNANFFAACMLLNFFIAFWFLSRKDKGEVYPVVARTWLSLLVLIDLFIVASDVATAGRGADMIGRGLSIPAVAVFAFLLHAATIGWFFMRRRVLVGDFLAGMLTLYYLFWIYQSQTRSAVVGLAASLVFLSIVNLFSRVGKTLKWASVGLILGILLLFSILYLERQSPWVQKFPTLIRYTSLSFTDVGPRLLAWKAGAMGIPDHPLFGWGPENYQNAYDLHFPPQTFVNIYSESWFDRAHNIVLDIGVTTGLIGLVAYFTFYILVFVFLLRRWSRTGDLTNSLLIAALLLGHLFQNLFSFDTVNTDPVVYLILAYVVFLSHQKQRNAAKPPVRELLPVSGRGWPAVGASAILLIPAFWYTVKRPVDSNLLLNQGTLLEKARDPLSGNIRYIFREGIIEFFQQASDFQTTGRFEVREEFANYASELVPAVDVSLQDKVRVIKQAVAFLEESIQQEQTNARHCMYLASLVNKSYATLQQADPGLARSLAERNLVVLQTAESLSPTRPQVFIERGQTLVWLGRIDEAIISLEKAVELSPWVKEPHVDLVVLYIHAGRYDEADREWGKVRALSVAPSADDYMRVINYFQSRRRYASVVALYREQVEKTPNDASLLSRLAAAYRDNGDRESARKTALKAATLSPDVAAGLQSFLESLGKPR